MKKIAVLFLLLSSIVAAAQDSSVLVLGFDDGSEVQAKIEFDDPTIEPSPAMFFGIGSIGDFDDGNFALHLKYRYDFSDKFAYSARYSSSIFRSKEALLSDWALMTHTSLWSTSPKRDITYKVYDAVDPNNKRVSTPYYATTPFKRRSELRLDAGLDFQTSRGEQIFFGDSSGTAFYTGRSMTFMNLVIGPSFSRTRSFKLTVNKKSTKTVYTKIQAGVNAAYTLALLGSEFELCSDTSATAVCTETDFDSVPVLNLQKLGFGFNIGYTTNIGHKNWFYSAEIDGVFRPWFAGDYFSNYEPGGFLALKDYQYGSKLLFIPRFSIGYSF